MIAPTITAAGNIHFNTSFSFIVITYYILIFDVGANPYEYLPDTRDSRLVVNYPGHRSALSGASGGIAHVLNFIKFFINCNSNEAQISYQFKYYSSMLQCSHCLYHHSNIGFLSDLHLLVSQTEQPLT